MGASGNSGKWRRMGKLLQFDVGNGPYSVQK